MTGAASAGEHGHARRGAYVPRRPETTVLNRAVAGVLEACARYEARGRSLPRFVSRELRAPSETSPAVEAAEAPRHDRRYAWPELMRRVFAIDVLECPDCGHALRILAAIHPPSATRAILECPGLPTRPPPIAPARLPGGGHELDLDLDPC